MVHIARRLVTRTSRRQENGLFFLHRSVWRYHCRPQGKWPFRKVHQSEPIVLKDLKSRDTLYRSERQHTILLLALRRRSAH